MRSLFNRKTWQYPALGFWENFFGGHITAGRLTVYGENAMHWGVTVRFRGGYLCFRLPLRCYGGWWPLYLYWSPDATPQRATWWGWGERNER